MIRACNDVATMGAVPARIGRRAIEREITVGSDPGEVSQLVESIGWTDELKPVDITLQQRLRS
jgi:hypothetical protein